MGGDTFKRCVKETIKDEQYMANKLNHCLVLLPIFKEDHVIDLEKANILSFQYAKMVIPKGYTLQEFGCLLLTALYDDALTSIPMP